MPTAKISTRGQTTIPKTIRDELDLRPGDRLEFSVVGDRVILRRASMDISELYGFLDSSDGGSVSVDEMNEAVKEAASESDDLTKGDSSD